MNHYFSVVDNTTGTSTTATAYAFSGRSLVGSHAVDRVHIRASAVNDGGAAVAVGVGDGSSIDTGAGDDVINVGAHARGDSTHAWAMRRSQIESGSGNDRVTLTATTGAANFDPAYVMTDSTLNLDSGNDVVQLKAHASGTAPSSVIGAYGALNSTINSGTDHDRISILASAYNRNGDAEAIGLGQSSSVITGTGDDVVSIKANAKACID